MYIDNMKKDEYSRDVLEKAIVKVVGVGGGGNKSTE